jgi:hypothetical protein
MERSSILDDGGHTGEGLVHGLASGSLDRDGGRGVRGQPALAMQLRVVDADRLVVQLEVVRDDRHRAAGARHRVIADDEFQNGPLPKR